jgi:CheY-like chemotaxis protein
MQPEPAKLRVLILEDDADTVELLSILLQERGYDTRTVRTRDHAAMQAVQDFSPQVILIDYVMVGMTAADFIRAIRTEAPRTQFVLLTARIDKAIALAHEFDIAFVTKPFDPFALYEVIERITGSGEHVGI